MKRINREADGGGTLAALVVGASLLSAKFGVTVGVSVFLIVFAIGGEVQRKVNQILDVLERK